MAHRKHYRKHFSRKQGIILTLLLSIVIGVFLGFFSIKTKSDDYYSKMELTMEEYLHNYNSNSNMKWEIFRDSFVKHGKYIVVIWLLGFIPVGGFFIYITLMVKGAIWGFTTGIFVFSYKGAGLLTACVMYAPQVAITLPICLFMSYCALNYILYNIGNPKETGDIVIKEYFLILLLGIILITAAALCDSFLTPIIVGKFF